MIFFVYYLQNNKNIVEENEVEFGSSKRYARAHMHAAFYQNYCELLEQSCPCNVRNGHNMNRVFCFKNVDLLISSHLMHMYAHCSLDISKVIL